MWLEGSQGRVLREGGARQRGSCVHCHAGFPGAVARQPGLQRRLLGGQDAP